MGMLWVFEERLERLHPPRRRTGHSENNYCPSLRKASAFGVQAASTPESKREGLKIILKFRAKESTLKIVELMSFECGSSRRLAYNVHNLNKSNIINNEELATGTIEFRGHEGIMDPAGIINWINVCVGLVEFVDSPTVDYNMPDQPLWSHVDDNDNWDN